MAEETANVRHAGDVNLLELVGGDQWVARTLAGAFRGVAEVLFFFEDLPKLVIEHTHDPDRYCRSNMWRGFVIDKLRELWHRHQLHADPVTHGFVAQLFYARLPPCRLCSCQRQHDFVPVKHDWP
jgi:hypothetical protein